MDYKIVTLEEQRDNWYARVRQYEMEYLAHEGDLKVSEAVGDTERAEQSKKGLERFQKAREVAMEELAALEEKLKAAKGK